MTDYGFTFLGHDLTARKDGSLWWPERSILCVSDLHLGKSERIARRAGTLLPPYETQETLWKLETAVAATDPRVVICLGDSFDDLDASRALDAAARKTLAQLQAGRTWIWIEGNHDPGPVAISGTHQAEHVEKNLVFRHIAVEALAASDQTICGEVSGHYHPKARLRGLPARPCFVISNGRIIMPAFGVYTGGLSIHDPALARFVDADARLVLTGPKATAIPAASAEKR